MLNSINQENSVKDLKSSPTTKHDLWTLSVNVWTVTENQQTI